MIKYIEKIIESNFDINVTKIYQTRGGWCAAAYIIEDLEFKYFLKVYDNKKNKSKELVANINNYMPVLEKMKDLRSNITVPILTKNRKYLVKDKEYTFILFEYIEAETLGEKDLNQIQIKNLANVIKGMHNFKINKDEYNFEEDNLSLKEIEELKYLIEYKIKDYSEFEIILKNKNKIIEFCNEIESLRKKIETIDVVLCHGDIHEYNIMLSENHVWLIDFEGLHLAPREKDIARLNESIRGKIISEYNYDFNNFAIEFYLNIKEVYELKEDIKDYMLYKNEKILIGLKEDLENMLGVKNVL